MRLDGPTHSIPNDSIDNVFEMCKTITGAVKLIFFYLYRETLEEQFYADACKWNNALYSKLSVQSVVSKTYACHYSHIFTSASYLNLLLSIGRDGQLRTSLYDEHDNVNFHITNIPFLSRNIPSSSAYGVFISQTTRYARACSFYECFILRAVRLANKLLGQGYVKERLKSSLRKFYGRYGDLIKQYGVPLSQKLRDNLEDDQIQWHPPLIRHYTNIWPCYWSKPYYRVWRFTLLLEYDYLCLLCVYYP